MARSGTAKICPAVSVAISWYKYIHASVPCIASPSTNVPMRQYQTPQPFPRQMAPHARSGPDMAA
eukprot:3418986-Rhodomonas_salina.2